MEVALGWVAQNESGERAGQAAGRQAGGSSRLSAGPWTMDPNHKSSTSSPLRFRSLPPSTPGCRRNRRFLSFHRPRTTRCFSRRWCRRCVASLDVARRFPVNLHFEFPAFALNPTLPLKQCRALHARCTHGILPSRTECHSCNVVHPRRVARGRCKS